MRILVTGGAGFLGSHMCELLIAKGYEVLALDNLYTGSESNIIHLADNERFQFISHDITSPLHYECDLIINFACPASPIHYQRDPVQTIKTNIHGAINVLEMAKQLSVPIFQASTSEVYGDPCVHPQPESYWGNVNPIGPRSCYDEGKRAAETLFFDYFRQHKVKIKVARIFNTYGPRMAIDDGRVVSNFIVAALRGKDLTIYGDGSQSRSLCYVDDLLQGIYNFIFESDYIGPLNLGTSFEVSVEYLANLVIRLTNSNSKIIKLPLPENDPKQRRPDLTLAEIEIGWRPQISIEEGLARTIEYFRKVV
jgi:UDP-glucuronate decarboxylase